MVGLEVGDQNKLVEIIAVMALPVHRLIANVLHT